MMMMMSSPPCFSGHEVQDPRYAMMTPVSDIPETVRFSSTSLAPGEAGTVFTPEQSFGHNILYSAPSSTHSHQMYHQPSNNMQVQFHPLITLSLKKLTLKKCYNLTLLLHL